MRFEGTDYLRPAKLRKASSWRAVRFGEFKCAASE